MTRAMKDSGIEWIGQIPENWNVKKNKYDIKYIKGKNPANTNIDGIGSPYIGASDLDGQRDYELFTTDDIPACQVDDILILWDGARAGLIGRNRQGKIASTVTKLEINSNIYSPFFYWYLKGFEKFLADMVGGTTIPHMNRKYIEDIFFLTIPYTEQQKIADYLDKRCEKIDTAIDNQKQIIEKLKEYKQSLITETVTKGLNPNARMKDSGIEWIGSIPEHWQDIKLKFNSYIRARLGWKGLKAEEYVEQGYPLLSAFNIINNKLVFEDLKFINQMRYDESPEIKLQKDDILLVKDGAGIGKCALVTNLPFPSTVNGSIAVVTTNKNLTSKFLYYYFLSKLFQAYIERLKDGMGVPHLFQSDLKEICIVSPNKLEQKEITEYLDKKCNQIDEAIKQKEETISKLEEYKKSLIFECVTGKKEVA